MSLFGSYNGEDIFLFHKNGNFSKYKSTRIYNFTLGMNGYMVCDMARPGDPGCPDNVYIDSSVCGPFTRTCVSTTHSDYVIVSLRSEPDTQFIFKQNTMPYTQEVSTTEKARLCAAEATPLPWFKLPRTLDRCNIHDNMRYMEFYVHSCANK